MWAGRLWGNPSQSALFFTINEVKVRAALVSLTAGFGEAAHYGSPFKQHDESERKTTAIPSIFLLNDGGIPLTFICNFLLREVNIRETQ